MRSLSLNEFIFARLIGEISAQQLNLMRAELLCVCLCECNLMIFGVTSPRSLTWNVLQVLDLSSRLALVELWEWGGLWLRFIWNWVPCHLLWSWLVYRRYLQRLLKVLLLYWSPSRRFLLWVSSWWVIGLLADRLPSRWLTETWTVGCVDFIVEVLYGSLECLAEFALLAGIFLTELECSVFHDVGVQNDVDILCDLSGRRLAELMLILLYRRVITGRRALLVLRL